MQSLFRTLLILSFSLLPLTANAHFQNFLARIIYLTEDAGGTWVYARVPMASLLLEPDWQQGENSPAPPYTRLNTEQRPMLDLPALNGDKQLLKNRAVSYLQIHLEQTGSPRIELESARIEPIAQRSPFGYLPAIEQTLQPGWSLPASTLLLEEAVIDLKLRVPDTRLQQIRRITSASTEWPVIRDQSINILTTPTGKLTSNGPLDISFAAPPGIGERLVTQFASGVHHVLIGLDHLLFLCVLVFGAKQWRRVIHNSLIFTAGHSLTLGAVALGWLALPPLSVPLIETLIALSIVYGFLRLLLTPDRHALPLWQVGMIGLLHGLGFANVLEHATGLKVSELLVHWAGFNLGIEAGQILVFVTLAIALWASTQFNYLNRTQLTKAIIYPSLALALFWTVERGLGWVETIGAT
ncbi:MAG: hypothetical protein CMI01_01395 [Oceanospirillaceae bacterium]|nr:hypothetical protein [Oceanospirillaceae bacterium]